MEFHGIEKLRGAENWNIWKFAVKNLLRGTEGAYEVCSGEIQKPAPLMANAAADAQAAYQVNLKAWDKADRAASQIIVKTLEAKVMALLVTCESAREIWLKLHSVYEQQTKQAAHTVQAEFFSFNKNTTDDIVTHIAKFEGLILRMQQLNVKPDESSLMVKLLDSLPDDYESLRQAWWARPEDQQTVANLVGVLTSDEKRRQQRAEKQDELVALMATKAKIHGKSGPGSFNSRKNNKLKKSAESASEGSKDKPSNFRCYKCNGIGHLRRDCKKKKQGDSTSKNGSKDEAFVCVALNVEEKDVWIVDSGATDHVTHHDEWFVSFERFMSPVKIHIGDKSTMDAIGKGSIKFEALVDEKWTSCRMENVLYVPTARRNLFSVTSALDKGMSFASSKSRCKFMKDGTVKAQGVRTGQLFKMMIRIKLPDNPCVSEVNVSSKDSLHIWHEKLGHQNKRHVKELLKGHGIDVVDDNQFCGACVEGKQHRSSFHERQQRAIESGEIIHADLCGPMECTSLGGSKYFICFTCDFSKLRMIYFLKEKSEATEKIAEMLQVVKNQRGRPIKTFQCDGGMEFNNAEVRKLLTSDGITLAITNPYTPQQNGCAERTNRTVVELARTMLLAKNLPKFLWAEAVNAAVYTLNRTGPSSVNGKTPYELFTGKNIHLEKFHVFGIGCYVHIPKEKRKKWDKKGKRGVFVGYSDNIDGFRIWFESENRVVRSKDVVFEQETAGKLLTLFPSETNDDTQDKNQKGEPEPLKSSHESSPESSPEVPDSKNEQAWETPATSAAGRQLRDRQNMQAPKRLVEMMVAEIIEPKNYSDAMKTTEKAHWIEAMKEEMISLEENSTWDLVDLPTGHKIISNRWIYRVKRDANGKINRYKARLVARGFNQREGIDYDETFSPVVRFDTIRVMLSIAANENLELAQFDVKSAFLNGVIKEEIYMHQPEGYEDGSQRVCKLLRSLYGLKQSPRCWNERFKKVMLSFRLQESTADPCLFYRNSEDDKLIVGIYVDDGLVVAKKKATIKKFLSKLKAEFRITAEPAGCFLNVLIDRLNDKSIVINQRKYTEDILRRFNMEEANSVSTPMERCQLTEEADEETTKAPYREAVGCLIYLAVATRPDIAFAVGCASKFLESPKEQHWTMVKRILKYLKGTTSMGIRYNAAGMTGKLESYCDADYAGDETTRRSVSGIVFKFSGGAIVWASKRQQSVALSTTEAEYVAASEAAKDAVWLSRLFNEISPLESAPLLLVDNASAIKLAKNPTYHKRSKHIDVRAHFVRERIQANELRIEHIPSNEQVADILTKPISRVQFQRLREKLGMVEQLSDLII